MTVDARSALVADVFKKHDKNGKGEVSRRVLTQVLVGIGLQQSDAEDILKEFDEHGGDRGDNVPYEEFVKWVNEAAEPPDPGASPKERVEHVFKAWDADGSGKITKSVLKQVLTSIGSEDIRGDIESLLESTSGEEVNYREWLEWMFQDQTGPATLDAMAYYASPKAKLVTVERTIDDSKENKTPAYATMDEFREKHAGNEALLAQMRNRVLICPNCGKPNAYTMKACNGCSTSLAGVKETFNDNIFMGFIYGIAKGRFPYAVSTRYEDKDILAFDDPLGITAVHLCVIPTSVFCPDIRFLFTDPKRGLKLCDDLMEYGRKAVLENYWADKDFCKKYWNGEEAPKTLEDMQELAVLGFNFPPSMFQLHLQFQHGPLFPFHEVQLRKGNHYHKGRFYPFEWCRAALALGDAVKMDINDDTPIEDVVAKVKQAGLDYDKMHDDMIAKGLRLSQRYNIWKKEDFEYTVKEGKVYSNETGAEVEGMNPVEVQKQDNNKMKNYGKPKCSLYTHVKEVGECTHFLEQGSQGVASPQP